MKLKNVYVYPNMSKLKLEYSTGTCDYHEFTWRENVRTLMSLREQCEEFTVHDILTGTSYKAGKKLTK